MKNLIRKILREDKDWNFIDDVDEWTEIKDGLLSDLVRSLDEDEYFLERKGDIVFIRRIGLDVQGMDDDGGYVVKIDEKNTESLDSIRYVFGVYIEYGDYDTPMFDFEEWGLTFDELIETIDSW